MICVSTRGQAPPAPFREALLAGLAPDGGLYVPDHLPELPPASWRRLAGGSLADVAAAMLVPLLHEDMPADALRHLLADALNVATPVVPLEWKRRTASAGGKVAIRTRVKARAGTAGISLARPIRSAPRRPA